jgi:hypothetical protein
MQENLNAANRSLARKNGFWSMASLRDEQLSAVDSTGDHHIRRPAAFGASVYCAVIDYRLTETRAA